jgi:hypothetical protein
MSLAHGGKDGHPFPVPLKVYDGTIRLLKDAVSDAKLGRAEKLEAIRRLDVQARRLESAAGTLDFEDFLAGERTRSASYGGRSVAGPARPLSEGRDKPGPDGIDAPLRRSVRRMAGRG